jgi:nucleoside diphosphate kinase
MINGPVAIVTFSGGPLDRGIVDDIRSQFGTSIRQNAIHASRTVEDEKRERAIFE